jgi:hypothetical protein
VPDELIAVLGDQGLGDFGMHGVSWFRSVDTEVTYLRCISSNALVKIYLEFC